MAKSVMKNSLLRKKKSLFYTRNESWWLIGFSILMASNILIEPQMITSFLLKGDLSGMWLVWSSGFGVAFGMVFFGHLWQRLPVRTENELLLFRFSGTGARWLHIFRSLYVGGLVAPLILSMTFLAFVRIINSLFGISISYSLLIVLGYIIVGTFFNSLKKRIRLDFLLLIIFSGLLLFIISRLFTTLGTLGDLKYVIAQSELNFSLFPDFHSNAINAFLVFVLLQWWAANIIDMPGQEGQKLMSAKNSITIAKSIVLPQLFFVVFFILINLMPFFILLIDSGLSESMDGETAFLFIFTTAFKGNDVVYVLIFFLIPFTVLTHNVQNWSGALLTQNFYKYYIQKSASEKNLNFVGTVVMLFVVCMSALIAFFSDSILDIFKYILTISAGVGPVFILRWYWHRINAWTQLAAMVASLIFPTIYDLLFDYDGRFSALITAAMEAFNLEYFPLKIVVLTLTVSAIWILVMLLTPKTDTATLRQFVKALKPGGIWPFKNKGNIQIWSRLAVALMLTSNFIMIYLMIWQLVNERFLFFGFLLVAYVLITLIAYKLLQKTNLKHG